MKQKIKWILYATIAIYCMTINCLDAQWQINTNGTDFWGEVDPSTNVQSIGIGTYGILTGNLPHSALEVNTNYMPLSPTFLPGEVFRTDCPLTYTGAKLQSTYWRLFNANSERGRIFTYGESDDANFFYPYTDTKAGVNYYIQSSYTGDVFPLGDLRFNTPGPSNPNGYDATPRMRIMGGNGNIGIGDFRTFEPQSLLHLHVPSFNGDRPHDLYEQFTNDNTTAIDNVQGFKIGITYNGSSSYSDAELLSQQRGAHMNFYTNSSGSVINRMRITAAGDIGIGITSPTAKVQIINSPNSNTTALRVNNTITASSAASYGVDVNSSANSSGSSGYGIKSTVSGEHASVGLDFAISNGDYNKGAYMLCNTGSSAHENTGYHTRLNGGLRCIGLSAEIVNSSSPGALNIGVHSYVDGYGNSKNIAVEGVAVPLTVGSSTTNTGYYALAGSNSIKASTNFGINILTQYADDNYGAFIQVDPLINGSTNNTGVYSYAGYGSATTHNSFGVYTQAVGGTNLNYGIYASGGTTCAASPSPANCPNAAGYFSGDVGVTHYLYQLSDSIFKDNIQPLTNGTTLLNQLNPVSYNLKSQQYPSLHLTNGNEFGLIAEQVKPLFPQLVRGFAEPEVKDSLGNIIYPQINYQAINYIGLVPILIAGFKEQTTIIDSLNTRLTNLEAIVASCCAANRSSNPNIGQTGQHEPVQIKLTNVENSILYQNEPNPYTSNTTIRYFIPENVTDVKIIFQDATGKTLKEIAVKETGQGSIVIDGRDLINGIYTYSLVVGGKVLDSKKMVKVK